MMLCIARAERTPIVGGGAAFAETRKMDLIEAVAAAVSMVDTSVRDALNKQGADDEHQDRPAPHLPIPRVLPIERG